MGIYSIKYMGYYFPYTLTLDSNKNIINQPSYFPNMLKYWNYQYMTISFFNRRKYAS